MKTIQITEYTKLEDLKITTAMPPPIQAGELLVRIITTEVNPLDWKLMTGELKNFMPTQFPFTPGFGGAGIVEKVGVGISEFSVGDRVYGRSPKMVAEYASMRANSVVKIPENLSFQQAAALPSSTQVAYSALHDVAKIQSGQKILIHGASGGVGQYAVQLAALAGAEVWTTTSTKNVNAVKKAGALHVIDYTKERFEDIAKEMDFVLDGISNDIEERSWSVLKRGGLIISLLRKPLPTREAEAQKKKAIFMSGSQKQHMQVINKLVTDGKLYPVIDSEYELSEAIKAYTKSRNGHVCGKIILRISPA